ncbi:hypothetical protein J1N35_011182 [Gossypium stocksii]|uniref:Uncharacterized protein n=1 Tax=Gossypium stocksii TaxID=47602 RepID=A0A9D4AD22_9ROSI|nr:hypothetical protein J1N35_011182 [Gossypium stocksii]
MFGALPTSFSPPPLVPRFPKSSMTCIRSRKLHKSSLMPMQIHLRPSLQVFSDQYQECSHTNELHISSIDPPTIWCDNSSTVAIAANPILHSKFKHVELDLFFVREKVASGSLVVGEVLACDQVVNIFTKPLLVSLFSQFRKLLRVLPIEKLGEC